MRFLNHAESSPSDIENRVHLPEERGSKDIKLKTAHVILWILLDRTEYETIPEIRMTHIILVNVDHAGLVVAHGKRNLWDRGAFGVHPSWLLMIVHCAFNLSVDFPDEMWMCEDNTRSSICDRHSRNPSKQFISDSGVARVKVPESAAIIDIDKVDVPAVPSGFVDESEGEEAVLGVETDGEDMFVQEALVDHVFDGCLDTFRFDRVKITEGKTEDSVCGSFDELSSAESGRELHGLFLNLHVADFDTVKADYSGRRGSVAVFDIPR